MSHKPLEFLTMRVVQVMHDVEGVSEETKTQFMRLLSAQDLLGNMLQPTLQVEYLGVFFGILIGHPFVDQGQVIPFYCAYEQLLDLSNARVPVFMQIDTSLIFQQQYENVIPVVFDDINKAIGEIACN